QLGASVLVNDLDQLRQDRRDAARALENADELALVVGDGELAERARAAAHDDDDVARADVGDFPTHQAAAGVDDDVEIGPGTAVLVQVLVERQPGRDAD